MTEAHRSPEWQRARRRALPILRASLPAPCVDCGRVIEPGDTFDVGHILAVTFGGDNSLANLGPSHVRCNRSAGGRMGARKTNASRDYRAAEENRSIDD